MVFVVFLILTVTGTVVLPEASWQLGLGACEQPHGGVLKVEEHFEFGSFFQF